MADFYLSNAWTILDGFVREIFFVANPWESLILVDFSDRNWSWWECWRLEFVFMAVDDNISSGLKSFFRMRTFLVFSNFDISVNSNVSDFMVKFFSFNCSCSISISSFVTSLSIMVDVYSDFHTVTYRDILWIFTLFSLSICNIIWFTFSLISLFGCIRLWLIPCFKFFNLTWIHLEWYAARSIDSEWNISFRCFLSFIDSFELSFEFSFSFKHLFLFICSVLSEFVLFFFLLLFVSSFSLSFAFTDNFHFSRGIVENFLVFSSDFFTWSWRFFFFFSRSWISRFLLNLTLYWLFVLFFLFWEH